MSSFVFGDCYIEHSNKGLIRKAINYFQKIYYRLIHGPEKVDSVFTPHCGIIIDRYHTFEASREGVKLYEWRNGIDKHKNISVFRPCFNKDVIQKAYLSLFESLNGHNYSFGQLGGFILAYEVYEKTGRLIDPLLNAGYICAETLYLFFELLIRYEKDRTRALDFDKFLQTFLKIGETENSITVIDINTICHNQVYFIKIMENSINLLDKLFQSTGINK